MFSEPTDECAAGWTVPAVLKGRSSLAAGYFQRAAILNRRGTREATARAERRSGFVCPLTIPCSFFWQAATGKHQPWCGTLFSAIRRPARLGLLFVVAFSLAASSAGAGRDTQTSALERSLNCGPNAIYMFLVLCGANPTEDSVRSIVYGADGASFADMIVFSETYGVHTEVRKYAPVDFQRMPLPAICQTRGGREHNRIKHFHVAYDVDPTGIWTLDGTTGKRARIRKDRIADYLSGYALVRKSSFLSVISEYDVWFTLTLVAANLVLLIDLSRKRFSVAACVPDRGDTSAESES
jgi:hypothetical protein